MLIAEASRRPRDPEETARLDDTLGNGLSDTSRRLIGGLAW